MDLKEDQSRKYFDDFMKKARKTSLSIRMLVDKSLNSEKLILKDRPGRIFIDIECTGDEIRAFDRPEYIENLNDADRLYELFKSNGNLYNTEELNKLQQAMNLCEKFTWLTMASFNATQLEHAVKGRKKDCSSARSHQSHTDVASLHPTMVKIDNLIHIVVAPTTIMDFTKAITCHDWSLLTKLIYTRCQINELKLIIDELLPDNNDLIYANVGKCGLFISKKGKVITAHHLSTSTYAKLKTRDRIQMIIAAYHKKA